MTPKPMTDYTSLILLEAFMTSHTKVMRNSEVLTDIDLAELFEADLETIQGLITSNLQRFQGDTIMILEASEQAQFSNARYALTDAGVFTLAGLIKTKKAIRIYVRFIELLVNKLQGKAYDIATTYHIQKS